MPLRRYHTPSFVRQTSSASIFPPLVNIITGLPPCRVPIPGPLVETGSLVARVCAVETSATEVFGLGVGVGDGDGEATGEGDGDGAGGVAEGVGATTVDVSVAAAAFCVR